jgi:hypothetical protein
VDISIEDDGIGFEPLEFVPVHGIKYLPQADVLRPGAAGHAGASTCWVENSDSKLSRLELAYIFTCHSTITEKKASSRYDQSSDRHTPSVIRVLVADDHAILRDGIVRCWSASPIFR